MDNFFKWLGYITQFAAVFIIPLATYWVTKLDKADIENRKDLNTLQKEFYEFKNEVSNDYLKRDEYLTVSGNLMKKIDEIAKAVYRIEGELKSKK